MTELLEKLAYSCDTSEQAALINQLKKIDSNALRIVQQLLGVNPFLDLPSSDRQALIELNQCSFAVNDLLLLRQIASKVSGRRVCVFCMPKSGSSFVQSALQQTLNIPLSSLTFFGDAKVANAAGVNEREQELDEFQIIHAIFQTGGSFIAQHHTRATNFLAKQLKFYNIMPILTIRNIFDCIISADDMFQKWSEASSGRTYPSSPFCLPVNYCHVDVEVRLIQLCYSLGVWLVNFFMAWKRIISSKAIQPLVIVYEKDILTGNIVAKLTEHFGLNQDEQARLASYVQSPDKKVSLFNKGVAGRGALIPEKGKQLVRDYVDIYKSELSSQDYTYLVGTNEA